MALWGFFDESGEHDTQGRLLRLTLGGFFAPWEEVKKLCERWRVALDEESLGEFHMKEIASDEERFATWSRERQGRLARFVDILCEHAQEFGAFSYTSNRRAGLFREVYQTALNRVFIDFATLCERTGERGHVVFARTHEISDKRIGGYFERLGWGEYLDGYTVQLARCSPGLQAAEIVARGMKRLMQDGGITYSFTRVLLAGAAPGKAIRFWPQHPFEAVAALGHSPRVLLTQQNTRS
jgi:hypothetical protein